MNPFRYRILVEWSDDDAAFVARVPALPGCAAHGETAQEATRAAQEAAEGILAVMAEDGQALPPSDVAQAEYSGQLRLRMPRSLHERLARQATTEGVSLNQFLVTLLAEGTGRRGAA